MFIRPTNQGKDLSYEKKYTAAAPSGEGATNKSSPASSNGNHNTTTSIVGGIGLCLLLVASTASSVVDVLTPASLSSEAVVPPPPSSSAATVPPSPSVDAAFDTNANDFSSSSSSSNSNSNNENHKSSHQQHRSSSSGSIPDRRYLAYATALAAESITDLDLDEDDLDDEDWGMACDDDKQNDNNDDDTSSSVCHANDTAAIARKIEEAMQQCPTKKRNYRPSGSNDLPTPPPADRNIGSGSLRIASALRTVVMRHILTAAAPKTPTDQQEKVEQQAATTSSKSRRRAEAAAAAARAILTMPANELYALLQSIPIDPTAEARIAERFYVAPPRPVLVGRWSEDDDATTLASFYTASVRDDATDASACESSDEMMTFGNDARTATTAPPSSAASSSASTFGAVPNITATTASNSSDDGSSNSNTDRMSSSTKKSRASSSLTDPRTEVVCCSATGAAVAASATETASCYAEDSCSSYEYGCYEVEPQHCEPVATSSPPPLRSMKLHRLAHDTSADGLAILRRIFECLPFNEVSVARTMAEGLALAGELVMPRPLGTQSMTFVRWVPPPLPTIQLPSCTVSLKCQQQQPGFHKPVPSAMFVAPSSANASFASSPFAAAQHQQQQPPMWRCTVCSTLSRAIQRCPHCATPLSRAACRVFIGQLRKDGTQGLVSHMLRTLCPLMSAASPLHIENHTNGNDGRGRGCAWVYLDCEADRQMVLEMHKRVFVDMEQQQQRREEGHPSCSGSASASSGEEEGYWVLTDDALGDDFAALAQRRGSDPKRKLVLPKQLLVAEVPNAAASSRNGQRQVQRYAAEAAASEVAAHPHHPSSSSYHSRPKEGSTNLMMKPSPAVPRLRQDDFHAAVASGAGYHSAPIECQRDEGVVVEESQHVSPDGAATTQVTYHHHHYHVHHFASSSSSSSQHPLEVPNGNYHQADASFYRHEPYAAAPATSFTTKQKPAAAPSSRAVKDQHQQHRFRHVPHDTNINHDDDAKMFPALPTGVSVASAFTAVAAAVVGGSSTAKSDTETKKAKQHRNSHNNAASFVAAPNRARRTTASAI